VIDILAKALGVEAEKLRAVEYYAAEAADAIVALRVNAAELYEAENFKLRACAEAADRLEAQDKRIAELEGENKEREEIIENHRKARKVAEAELADRRSHDAERQQEWFVTQHRAEAAESRLAEVARLTQERDRWREDSLRQTSAIQRLADAALDRDKVDAIRHQHYEADNAALAALKDQERDKDQWRDLYITALDKARGYRGIDGDSTLADALQTLVDMRLSAESRLAEATKEIERLERVASNTSEEMFDRNQQLKEATKVLQSIASCESHHPQDVVALARAFLEGAK
jgi:hypothetical protein